jgi:hypothetical protein
VDANLPEQTVDIQHWFVHSLSRLSFSSWICNMIGLEQYLSHQQYTTRIGPICVLAQALPEDSSIPPSGNAAEAVDKKDVNTAIQVYIRAHIGPWLEFAHSLNMGILPREITLIRGHFRRPPSLAWRDMTQCLSQLLPARNP